MSASLLETFLTSLCAELDGSPPREDDGVLLVVHLDEATWTVERGRGGVATWHRRPGGRTGASEGAPWVATDGATARALLARTEKPLVALARGRVRVGGPRDAWAKLAGPARAAARAVAPVLEAQLPWPTWAGVEVVTKASPQWVGDDVSPCCQVCGEPFSLLFSRRHHCRLCGKLVCAVCSPHLIAGNRACAPCFNALTTSSTSSSSAAATTTTPSKAKATATPHFVTPLKAAPSTTTTTTTTTKRTPATTTPTTHQAISSVLTSSLLERESQPIRALAPQTELEMTLKSQAMASLQTTRSMQKELDQLTSKLTALLHPWKWLAATVGWWTVGSFMPVALVTWAATRGGYSVAAVALAAMAARAVGGDGDTLSRQGLWRVGEFSAVVLGVVSHGPPLPLSPLSLGGSRPGTTAACLAVFLGTFALNHVFHRVMRIYSVSMFIILSYQAVRVVSERVLKMEDTTALYEAMHGYFAPYACNQVLHLKSVFTKFGQYLGARSDLVPEQWNSILSKLQDDMPLDSQEYILSLLKAEGYAEEDFELPIRPAVASASVAQVHRVTYRGEACALKVQHENIDELMRADMLAFRRIVRFAAWLNPRFEGVSQLLTAWEREMLRELDFLNEAENLRVVSENLAHLRPSVVVPHVIQCTRRVLVMRWEEGFKITDQDMLALHSVDRAALLNRILAVYGYQLFVDGMFNADPHPGNLMVRVDDATGEARLILLDFGMTVKLPTEVRLGFCELVHALSELSVSGLQRAIRRSGYQNSQSDTRPERDLEFFAFLLRDTGSREEQRKGRDAFNDLRKKQRDEDTDGGTRAVEGRYFKQFPDELIFLMRTLGLLRGLCTTLQQPVAFLGGLADHAKLALARDCEMRLGASITTVPLRVPSSSLESRLRNALSDRFREGAFLGGVQVSARWWRGGHGGVDVAMGTMGDYDSRAVTTTCLFPCLELSRVVCALAALDALYDGFLAGRVNALQGPLVGPGGGKGVRIVDVLTHAKRASTRDAVPPSSLGHVLKDYDLWLGRVTEAAMSQDAAATTGGAEEAENHALSFGVEVDVYLRSNVGLGLRDYVTKKLSVESGVPTARFTSELFLGHVPEKGEVRDRVVRVSHGYGAMVRGMVSSGAPPPTNTSTGGGGGGVFEVKALPGRVHPDCAMVNDPAVMSSFIPSLNAYASARTLCDVTAGCFERFDKAFLKQICLPRTTEPGNMLHGADKKWGLGFVVFETDDGKAERILVHYSFGGSLVVVMPQRRVTLVVLVSNLTPLDRTLVREVVVEVLVKELGALKESDVWGLLGEQVESRVMAFG